MKYEETKKVANVTSRYRAEKVVVFCDNGRDLCQFMLLCVRSAWPGGGSLGEAWLMQPRAFTNLSGTCTAGFSRFRDDGGEVGEVERLLG